MCHQAPKHSKPCRFLMFPYEPSGIILYVIQELHTVTTPRRWHMLTSKKKRTKTKSVGYNAHCRSYVCLFQRLRIPVFFFVQVHLYNRSGYGWGLTQKSWTRQWQSIFRNTVSSMNYRDVLEIVYTAYFHKEQVLFTSVIANYYILTLFHLQSNAKTISPLWRKCLPR